MFLPFQLKTDSPRGYIDTMRQTWCFHLYFWFKVNWLTYNISAVRCYTVANIVKKIWGFSDELIWRLVLLLLDQAVKKISTLFNSWQYSTDRWRAWLVVLITTFLNLWNLYTNMNSLWHRKTGCERLITLCTSHFLITICHLEVRH